MKLEINPNALKELERKSYPDVLTAQQVQKVLKIGRLSVYQLIENNKIPAFRIGRVYYIPKKTLAQFLEMRGEVS
ncbi:helix-turn-helix domain-containing protein [Acutalibacter intestini]|uniref:helix-turn-helix domain-containing protein n=1 Tax=Acutalibacter intestini TaxID=3093659 RepID=UPI002AC8B58A|nr:helix-turn-helix domain-containing protein [Acutalibacter sp. M00204]